MLWVPVEKLFMSEIGFDAAAVGAVAAAYAAVVPIVEVPSGILADRWSRRGVLIVASIALALCALVGGLSTDVPIYLVSTLFLGVFFAMHLGTLDAVVYDTVLEENGQSDAFEQRIGRVRLTESLSLVAGALSGGWIASLTSTRLTYFLTVPFAVLSVLTYRAFREPRLHRTGARTPLRRHLSVTYRTLTRRGRLLPVVTLTLLVSLLLQLIIEFGPLWLVALGAPAILYGPYWAGLMSTFGLGGLLRGRIKLGNAHTAATAATLMILAGLALTATVSLPVVTIAQITLALLLTIASTHVSRLLHDAVPSSVRTGVASGAGALSWLVFIPIALTFGLVSAEQGVHAAGRILSVLTALTAGMLTWLAVNRRWTRPAEPDDRPPNTHTFGSAVPPAEPWPPPHETAPGCGSGRRRPRSLPVGGGTRP
jgi:MFS family permease